MCRGFPYETSTTCKKEGKVHVKRRILRSITLSRYNEAVFVWRDPSKLMIIGEEDFHPPIYLSYPLDEE
jgi:hypothetical protein